MTTPNPSTNDSPAYNPDDLVIPSFSVPPLSSEASKGTKQRSVWRRRLICIAIFLAVIAAGAIGIMVTLTGNANPTAIFVQEGACAIYLILIECNMISRPKIRLTGPF